MPGAERLRVVQALFEAAIAVPREARVALVDGAAAPEDVRQEVLRLLRHEDDDDAASLDAVATTLARTLVPALIVGTQVGRFRIERELGAGGMGRVFGAVRVDGAVQQQVAIKLMRAELGIPELRERFLRERRLLATLDHPGICRLIDAGSLPDGTPFVAMELVDGEELLVHCDRVRAGIAQRLALFREILSAVSHAHQRLVVHRDIKPSNVLVDGAGRPRLLDFGIAKALSRESDDATATHGGFFTPCSAAPEQLLGQPVGVAADVYGLGALLYQLLCGKPPVEADGLTRGQLERRVLEVPPAPMASRIRAGDDALARCRGEADAGALRRRLRGDLESVVQRCLRKSAGERYASVEQLDADIANVLALRPIAARGGDRRYRAWKFVQRHRAATGLAAALLVAIGAAVAIVSLQAIALVEQHQRTLAERDRAQQAVTLLKQAFIGADPARAAGGEVRARQVLEAARPDLERLEHTQPELFAELGGTVAEVELALGMDRRAGELARRAAQALERSGGRSGDIHRLHALGALALAGGGHYEEAGQALAAAAAHAGGEPAALWHLAQAKLARHQGEFEASVDAARRALAQLRDAAPGDETALAARWQLADALGSGQRHADALAEIDATLAWQRQGLPAEHPGIAHSRLRRAQILRRLGRTDEALSEASTVLGELERLYGADSAFVALGHSILSLVHADRKAPAPAIEHQRRALRAWTQSMGEGHSNALRSAFNLAVMLSRQADGHDEADLVYRRLLRHSQRSSSADSNGESYFRVVYARFLLQRERPRRALEVLVAGNADARLAAAGDTNRAETLAALEEARSRAGCAGAEAAPAATTAACARASRLLDEAPGLALRGGTTAP